MDGSTRGEGTSEWGRARPPVDDRSLRRRTVSKSSCARKTLRGNGRGGPGCWSDCECSVGMLVCFGGAIAGGKTSVSREVAKALGCGWAGFGAYLRAEVGAEDSQCRKVLQDLGPEADQEERGGVLPGRPRAWGFHRRTGLRAGWHTACRGTAALGRARRAVSSPAVCH